jgi:hypothetical protein
LRIPNIAFSYAKASFSFKKKEEWAMLNPYMFLYCYSRVSHRQCWFGFWGSIDLNGPITTLMPIWLHHWRPVRAHFPGCDPWDFLGARWSCH